MTDGVEKVNLMDVIWSYIASIFQVGAGLFLLPFILHKLSSETVAIWNVFQIVSSLVVILDFGFRPSFARNVGYIFSGVRMLKVNGIAEIEGSTVDYLLLKKTIAAMQYFYRMMSSTVLFLLLTFGTAYFFYILDKYDGDRQDAIVAWFLLCIVNCYELYTYYYDALLTGKGYVKQSQKIMVVSRCVYLLVAILLITYGMGLVAIILSQLISIVLRRVLSYRVFYLSQMKERLQGLGADGYKDILKAISPNAVKVGLTYLGGFCINKSTVLLGTVFLPLEMIASYGVTLQVMDVLTKCGMVVYQAWTPRIVQARALRDMKQLKTLFVQSVATLSVVMLLGGALWCLLGNLVIEWIGSNTCFISISMLVAFLVFQLLEKIHGIAAGFIQADNRIPFFIPSLVSGACTILLLWLFLSEGSLGLWSLILAPGVVQLCYQNWKWPLELCKEIRNG